MRRRPGWALVACLILLFTTTACEDGSARTAQPPKTGFVAKRTQGSFAQEMSDGFRAGARLASGVDVTVTGPPIQDGYKEVELFRELAGTARGGMAAAASEPALIAEALAQAGRDGVPVVTVDARPSPGSGVQLHVGNDNYELGQLLADEVAKGFPPNSTGTIILGNTAPGLPALDNRAQGIRDQLARRLPGVRVVGPFDTQRDPAANLDAWQRLVAANSNAIAFLGTGDADGFNLASIRTRTKGTWLAAGFGVDPKTLQAIHDGDLVASVSPEHFVKGALAGWLLAEHATERRPLPSGWVYTPGLLVTASNVDDVTRRQATEDSKWAASQPTVSRIINDLPQFIRPLDQAR